MLSDFRKINPKVPTYFIERKYRWTYRYFNYFADGVNPETAITWKI